eukprot:s1237_g26.t1
MSVPPAMRPERRLLTFAHFEHLDEFDRMGKASDLPSTTSMWSLLAVWCCVTWPSLSTAVDGVLWSAGADVLMVSEFDKPSLTLWLDERACQAAPQHAVGAAVPGAVVQSAPTSAQHRLVAGLSQQDNFNTPGTNQSVHAVSTSYPQQLVDPRIAIETRRTKMICAQILGGLVVSAMVPVLVYQGWWAFVSLSTLLLSLTVVQVAMKAALHDGLPYPYSLTAASQQTATGRTCCILSRHARL